MQVKNEKIIAGREREKDRELRGIVMSAGAVGPLRYDSHIIFTPPPSSLPLLSHLLAQCSSGHLV